VSRRIAIVGAGQSGLQLALGLAGEAYEVALVSNQTAEQFLHGRVQSSQCMFGSALETERALGLDLWSDECPPVEGIAFAVPTPDGATTTRRRSNWLGQWDRRDCLDASSPLTD
jgi:2-polyprenyl-6-methoxyphenol hydroxylase-like FAD-dependent oxidoreductase